MALDLAVLLFRADFFSPFPSVLSNFRFNFSFLGNSLLKTGIITFFRVVGLRVLLVYLRGYMILLDFFLLVLGLTDSTVGLLLTFLGSFLS